MHGFQGFVCLIQYSTVVESVQWTVQELQMVSDTVAVSLDNKISPINSSLGIVH